jgi:phage shock protein A
MSKVQATHTEIATMFKIFTTLVRGAVAEAEEAAFDANATRVLAQQLRDAAAALEHSKRELACAMAYRASEHRAAASLDTRIAELEASAVSAIGAGRDDLASEAAAVIAATEDERHDRRAAIARFDTDIARLRQLTDHGRKRLLELRRGLEMARVQEALHRAGANGRRALALGSGALREAEATLARIKERQLGDEDMHAALEELEREATATSLDERMAAAGFGPSRKTAASDVMARLKARASAQPQPPATRGSQP